MRLAGHSAHGFWSAQADAEVVYAGGTMIISEIVGGLGNQMFQYAAGLALAQRLGVELKLDVSHYQGPQRPAGLEQFSRKFMLPHFNVPVSVATVEEVRRVRDRYAGSRFSKWLTFGIRRRWPRLSFGFYLERSPNFDPGLLKQPNNVYLSGYWQNERYFKSIETRIRREFTPRDGSLSEYAAKYVGALRREGLPVVSVHIRRGDLAHSVEVLRDPKLVYGPPVSLGYIRTAMLRFGPENTFLVFSDSEEDRDWCRANLPRDAAPRIEFSRGHTDLQDLAIMSACDHHIIANSSFSWWAAWLNPSAAKKVIAPATWFDPARYPDFRTESLLPGGWESIG